MKAQQPRVPSRPRLILRPATMLLGILLLAQLTPAAGAQTNDPAAVLGPQACGECHGLVMDIWKQTQHHDTFFRMHRRRQAGRIAQRLELARIKQNDRCARCHYTMVPAEDNPVAGISCEDCHGPARDWNKAHSDPTDPDRLTTAEGLGLIRPSNLYGIASRCYVCHTVPDEELVNRGGHPPGSEFELVAWLQGEVRHNISRSQGRINEETPLPRRRIMYVLGWALDLEYGLRGLAEATEEGDYARALLSRIRGARRQLARIQELQALEPVERILKTIDTLPLSILQKERLLAGAEIVGQESRAFADAADGSTLAALDPLLPKPKDYCGRVHQPRNP